MLEGHFISATLDISLFSTDHWAYVTWLKVRTITAPLFLMVSGIIFAYLLTRSPNLSIRDNPRIKKGLKRAFQLFVWGVLLHVSVLQVNDYLNGTFGAWLFSFHILQCIAVGLVVMVLIYLLFKLLGGKLVWYYLIAATLITSAYPALTDLQGYYPKGAHPFIQNAIKGPMSVFPLIPWLAFILYGAAIGAYLSTHRSVTKTIKFPLFLILTGLFLNFGLNHLLFAWDEFFLTNVLSVSHWFGKMGGVLMILGGLMLVLQKVPINTTSLWVRIGQQTLVMYLLHSVVLYGAIIGIGLDSFIGHSLSPWQAVTGAVVFLAFFTWVAVVTEQVKRWLGKNNLSNRSLNNKP